MVNNFKAKEWVLIQKNFQKLGFKISLISKRKSEVYLSNSKLQFLKESFGGKFAVVHPIDKKNDTSKFLLDNLDGLLAINFKLVSLGSFLTNTFHSLDELFSFKKLSKNNPNSLQRFTNNFQKIENLSFLNNVVSQEFNFRLKNSQISFLSLIQQCQKKNSL
jgi:hypothetical protein